MSEIVHIDLNMVANACSHWLGKSRNESKLPVHRGCRRIVLMAIAELCPVSKMWLYWNKKMNVNRPIFNTAKILQLKVTFNLQDWYLFVRRASSATSAWLSWNPYMKDVWWYLIYPKLFCVTFGKHLWKSCGRCVLRPHGAHGIKEEKENEHPSQRSGWG